MNRWMTPSRVFGGPLDAAAKSLCRADDSGGV